MFFSFQLSDRVLMVITKAPVAALPVLLEPSNPLSISPHAPRRRPLSLCSPFQPHAVPCPPPARAHALPQGRLPVAPTSQRSGPPRLAAARGTAERPAPPVAMPLIPLKTYSSGLHFCMSGISSCYDFRWNGVAAARSGSPAGGRGSDAGLKAS
jgi:hypothetical protein